MLQWEGPAIVLEARPHHEADALVTIISAEHGLTRGLVRGGASRRNAAVWERGNLIQASWTARLADQLGTLAGELVHHGASRALESPINLLILAASCAVTEGALPEREAHPILFGGLVELITGMADNTAPVETLVRWEAGLLAELGYGLDLTRCAVTGVTEGLCYVSPRTGRAVSAAGAGVWASRLLKLPGFLVGAGPGGMADWRDGLRLTGHFLARDAFGAHHRPLPSARFLLYDRVSVLADESELG